MGFTNFEQLRATLLCGGVGFLLGAYYDLFRVWRLWFSPRAVSIFFGDVFFCLSSVVAVFVLLLAITDGQGRFYVFLGIVIGFFAYRSLFGRYCRCAAVAVKRFVCKQHQQWRKKHAKKPKKAKKGLESKDVSVV